jgi:hypothetical protein
MGLLAVIYTIPILPLGLACLRPAGWLPPQSVDQGYQLSIIHAGPRSSLITYRSSFLRRPTFMADREESALLCRAIAHKMILTNR